MFAQLRAAFAYFSTLPVLGSATLPAPSAQTLVVLPLVGAVVGAFSAALAYGLAFIVPHAFVVAAAFAAPLVLTGAIHLDGFLDSCDALFASVPVARRLEIFKDPHHGTFAVCGLLIGAVFALAALWTLAPARLLIVMPFAAALARFAAVTNALFLPYARIGTATPAFAEKPSRVGLAAVGVALLAAGWFIDGGLGMLLVPVALIVALVCGWRLSLRLGGGLVGDVYGFLIVCLEIGLWAAFSIAEVRLTPLAP